MNRKSVVAGSLALGLGVAGMSVAACTGGNPGQSDPVQSVDNCVEVQQEWIDTHPKPTEVQRPTDVNNWEWLEHPDRIQNLHEIEAWASDQLNVFSDCLEGK